VIVDGDVDAFPAGRAASPPGRVGDRWLVAAGLAGALARAALDAPELLMSMWISSPGARRS
jgi:hypothetical protein